jgi:hypothetical protein
MDLRVRHLHAQRCSERRLGLSGYHGFGERSVERGVLGYQSSVGVGGRIGLRYGDRSDDDFDFSRAGLDFAN